MAEYLQAVPPGAGLMAPLDLPFRTLRLAEAIRPCCAWSQEHMPPTTTDTDHRAGRAWDELARIMAHTTEACLQEQITELQVDLAAARLALAHTWRRLL